MLVDTLDDAGFWPGHDRSLDLFPDSAHFGQEGVRFLTVIEVELDHYVVGIIYRSRYAIPADTRRLAASRITVKHGPPFRIIGDLMLDLQAHHRSYLHAVVIIILSADALYSIVKRNDDHPSCSRLRFYCRLAGSSPRSNCAGARGFLGCSHTSLALWSRGSRQPEGLQRCRCQRPRCEQARRDSQVAERNSDGQTQRSSHLHLWCNP